MRNLLLNAFQHRHLLRQLIWRDLTTSYSGSVLGNAWVIIDPLIYVGLTLFFFQFAIRGGNTGGVPYVAWVLPQIVFWTFINNVINSSVGMVKEYGFILRHKSFDTRLIVLIKLASATIIHVFLMICVVLSFVFVLDVHIGWRIFSALYFFFSMSVLLIGISWIVSSLGVFWKDIRNVVSVVLQVQFWISPIFWVPDGFPFPVSLIMYLNPFYYPMQGYRQSILSAPFGHYDFALMIYFWCVALALFVVGSRFFVKLSRSFGDAL